MGNMNFRYLFLILFLFLEGCIEPQELKILNWHDNAIRWTVVDGGATTSYLWKIYFQKNGSKRKRLIFQSYASPNISDISVSGEYLIIHSGGDRKDMRLIQIDMRKVDDFVDNPVIYRRSVLEQTNSSYQEPDFVKGR